MAITFTASPAGVYGFEDVQASTQATYYLTNGSYNMTTFEISHISVANYQNGVPVVIAFSDGSNYTVPPYTNTLVRCEKRNSCTITNAGLAPLRVTLMNGGHARAYESQYNMPPWATAASLNQQLFHYTEIPPTNHGNDSDATNQLVAPATQSITGGRFQSATLNSGYVAGAISTASMHYLRPSVAITATQNFTLDFWAYGVQAYGTTNTQFIISEGSDLNFRYDLPSTTWRLSATVSAATPAPALGVWFHVALVRDGGSIDVFINGVRVLAGVGFTTGITAIKLMSSSLATTIARPFGGRISEVRLRYGVVWVTTFTPPTAPYN